MKLFEITEDVITVDRSTLERFANCPRQAAFLSHIQQLPTMPMEIGTQAHEAVSQSILAYDENNMSPNDIANFLTMELQNTRADLQSHVLDSIPDFVRKQFGWMLANQHPYDLLKFDGGTGSQSGQVSRDVETAFGVVRVTTEIDLLLSTESPDVVAEYDWKTGWTRYTRETVFHSFQFQLHWWILSEVYPDVKSLDVTIWNTKHGTNSDRVRFTRKQLDNIHARMLGAIGDWQRWKSADPLQAEARPFQEKCGHCAFSQQCAGQLTADLTTPETMVDCLVVMDAARDRITEQLWKAREQRGQDIRGALTGAHFGSDKVKQERKPTNPLYFDEGSL